MRPVLRPAIALLLAAALALAGLTPASAATSGDSGPLRGLSVAGAEFSSAGLPVFDHADSFTFLASRGYTVVRLPFTWEALQPTLSQPLADAAVTRLAKAVLDAGAAGLSVILDVHNYARYRGVAYGDAGSFSEADFADLWSRLAMTFGNDPAVVGYGLMNEPRGLPAVNGVSGNLRWQHAQQAALDAIRATGDTTCVLVSGYAAASMGGWLNVDNGQPVPYIVDPADNFRWEAHNYWDADGTGKYAGTYADAVAAGFGTAQGDAARTRIYFALNQWIEWLKANGQKGYIGEFGWPSDRTAASPADAAAWNSLAEMFLARIDQESGNLLWATAWATGTRWSEKYALQFYGSTDGVLTTALSNAGPLEAEARAVGPQPPPVIVDPVPVPVPVPTPTATVDPVQTPAQPEPAPVTQPSPQPAASVPTPSPVVTAVPGVAVPLVTKASAKAKATVTVKASRVKGRVKLVIRVKASRTASGVVTVTDGRRSLGRVRLSKGKGMLAITRKLSKGVHKLTVRYAGSSVVTAASKTVKVRVK